MLINLLKVLYCKNKIWFIVAILVIAVLVISGCAQPDYGSAPSGPIGGGC